MIIEKFENMGKEKYKNLEFIEKKILEYYNDSKENNYSEITITDFMFNGRNIIKGFINGFKNLNISKINFAIKSTGLLEDLYDFQELGCKLGKIILLKDEYNQEQKAIEIYIPQ